MKTNRMVAVGIALLLIGWLLYSADKRPSQAPLVTADSGLQIPPLSDASYQAIATGIFKNETGGQFDKLTYWGSGEDFPSLGIGHFIWFPQGVDAPFDEQFPKMVDFVRTASGDSLPMPAWLQELQPFDAPWANKQQFDTETSTAQLAELRQWLWNTRHYQAQFIVSAFKQRWQELELPDTTRTEYNHILQSLMQTPDGLFAVMDYYNFKGLGNNPRERYQEQGWGLLQVLQEMAGADADHTVCKDWLQEFSNAAAKRLTLRVELAPPQRQEDRWLKGWLKRLSQYLENESVARRVSGCGFRVKPYLQNPSPTAITISWLSNTDEPGLLRIRQAADTAADSTVDLQSSPVLARALGYHPEENCQEVYCKEATLPYLHQLRLFDLMPASDYQYTVVQDNAEAGGKFSTIGPETDSIRLIVYADSETEPESTGKHSHWPGTDGADARRVYLVDQTTGYANNLEVIRSRNPDIIAIAGDLVESGGEQRDWDEFWWHNNRLAGDSVILPSPGNHEYFAGPGKLGKYDQPDSERALAKYLSYFDLPGNGSADPTHQERYYSIQLGPVSLVVLDPSDGQPHQSDRDPNWRLRGENDGGNAPDWNPGSLQYAWLEQQLLEARETSAFTFVMFHAAPYTSGVHGQLPGEGRGRDILSSVPLKSLTPLFMRYGVDAVFSGHDEMYEHSLVSGQAQNKAGVPVDHQIHFFDVGIGGDGLRGPVPNVDNPDQVFLAHSHSKESWAEDGTMLDGGKHYGHLEVNINRTENGGWKASFDPVYVFPLIDAQQQITGFERRIYADSFTLESGNLE